MPERSITEPIGPIMTDVDTIEMINSMNISLSLSSMV